jgi:MFS family permease
VTSDPLVATRLPSALELPFRPPRGVAYLLVFSAAAVGTGLVRTVTTTYLPLLLAEIREAPALIGLVMMVNSAAGFAVPLVVGRWSDRRHTPRHGRRPFIAAGTVLAVSGLAAAALGHGTSFLVLTLAGAVAYVGVNVVTTAHRALVHDCFAEEQYARGNGAQEVAALAGGAWSGSWRAVSSRASPRGRRSSSQRSGCRCLSGRRFAGCRWSLRASLSGFPLGRFAST